MKRHLATRLLFKIDRRLSLIALMSLSSLLLGFPQSSALAQRFDDVISNVFIGACAGLSPTGNLAARCGAGISGASGGSTTALTNDSSPALERRVEKLMGPWNLYVAGDYENFHKQVTTFEPGYNNNIWRGALGADYGLSNSLLLGGALRYAHEDGDFRGGGDFDSNSYGFLLHANYLPTAKFFLDTSFGYMRKNSSIRRAVFFDAGAGSVNIGSARGKPDSNEFQAGLNGGYDFSFQNVTVGPRLGLNYKHDQIDAYREKGSTGLELKYNDQNQNSLTTNLGVHGSVAISTSIGVLVPQVALEYLHEFLDPQRKIRFKFAEDLNSLTFKFENDRPDRNYFNLGGGVVLQLARGIAPFVNYRALVGYRDQSSHRVTAGVRIEF
jgi:outer membrane autotransporter protein